MLFEFLNLKMLFYVCYFYVIMLENEVTWEHATVRVEKNVLKYGASFTRKSENWIRLHTGWVPVRRSILATFILWFFRIL